MVETLSKIYLSLEFAGGGELYQYVIQQNKLPEDEAKRIFAQVLAAVIHMVRSVVGVIDFYTLYASLQFGNCAKNFHIVIFILA